MDGAEIARRFALGRGARLSTGPVARGKQGVVWRLDTADGRWAVKVPLFAWSEEDVRRSTAFQEAAHAAGVPSPLVRRTPEGGVSAVVGGTRLRVFEYVDLEPPDLFLDPAEVGAAVGAIHRVGAADPEPDPGRVDEWYSEPVGARRWDELVQRLLDGGAPFAARLAGLRDELVGLEAWLEPPVGVQTCHRDLWADNVLPVVGGGVCVIDWENSGPADPSQELGCVLFEFARSDPGRARALADAYREAGGHARVDRPGHFSMLIAQLGHITEIAGSDWLKPNPRSPSRDDAAAWIAETLDDPHSRARLEALLQAVRPSG